MYLDHVYIDAHTFNDERVLQQDRKIWTVDIIMKLGPNEKGVNYASTQFSILIYGR